MTLPEQLTIDNLLPNEGWIEAHVERAGKMYSHDPARTNARLIAGCHRAAIDYVQQCPLLAVMVGDGKTVWRRKHRSAVAWRVGTLVGSGPKLKRLMSQVGIPYPLRAVKGSQLELKHYGAVVYLREVPSSVLAQAIPATSGRQAAWLTAVKHWCLAISARLDGDEFEVCRDWFVAAAGARVSTNGGVAALRAETGDLADFVRSNAGRFQRRWSWEGALARAAEWHVELAEGGAAERACSDLGVGMDDVVDLCVLSGLFVHGETGFELHALRTPRALFIEGGLMRHCVGAYLSPVISGDCSIYSVRTPEGVRLATLEVGLVPSPGPRHRWAGLQLKGRYNRSVGSPVERAASAFISEANRAARGGPE